MNDLASQFKERIGSGLVNRTLTTCSRWSEHRRYMMVKGQPRPFSTKRHPWVREPLDSEASQNWFMKSAQMGVTEAAINRALYTIDRLRRDVLYVLPTAAVANDFSRARFKTALDLSPYLKSIFTDVDTVGLKQAGNTNLYIRGAGGKSNLVSIPVAVLVLDELDRMDKDKIKLAMERLSGQDDKEVWGISTPTIPGHGIQKVFEKSTQEHFYFKCPSCSRMTKLVWPDCIEMCGDDVHDPRVEDSFIKCKECKAKLPHQLKGDWLGRAEWVAENLQAIKDIRGFAINQLYSFTVTPAEMVRDFFAARGDEAAIQVFTNEKLGLPYLAAGAKVNEVMLARCIGKHSREDKRPTKPDKIRTMGVDQGKTCYVSVVEWELGNATHDINTHATGKLLWQGTFGESQWSALDALMAEWQILMCVVDADPEINEARRFARRFRGFVHLCRYRKGCMLREIKVDDDEEGAPLATVDRANWLSATLSRFKSEPPRIWLPTDTSEEFKDHIQNVVATYQKEDGEDSPRLTFVNTGPDHFCHSLNYAEIALPLARAVQTNRDVQAFL